MGRNQIEGSEVPRVLFDRPTRVAYLLSAAEREEASGGLRLYL